MQVRLNQDDENELSGWEGAKAPALGETAVEVMSRGLSPVQASRTLTKFKIPNKQQALCVALRVGAQRKTKYNGVRQVSRMLVSCVDRNDSDDKRLLSQIAAGDAAAFSEFYDRHSRLLFSIILRIVGNEGEAEDTLQDTALLFWDRAAAYNPAFGKPLGWAVAIARNKAIDRIRSRNRHQELLREVTESEYTTLTDRATPGNGMTDDTVIRVRAALAALGKEQRSAIELAFFGGLSQNEIATHLNEPLGTIKARIRRGMLTMRDALEGVL